MTTNTLNCTCAKSNWDSLSCPMHGLDAQHILVLCPGGCNEHLDPDYINNAVIIDGDPVKVCDQCLDTFQQCSRCERYFPADEVETIYPDHDFDPTHICEDCGNAAHRQLEAMFGRGYWR